MQTFMGGTHIRLRLMSELNDPRVLFAAERTLLAWNRTVAGLMALGFFIDRASLMAAPGAADRRLAGWVGIAFVVLGVALNIVSILHYRRALETLRPAEIPPRYSPNLAAAGSLGVAILGALLALYLFLGL
jgi:putative membrane protein